jgi:hypothetical protein
MVLGRTQVDPYGIPGLPANFVWLRAGLPRGVIALLLDGTPEFCPITSNFEMIL